MGSLRLELLHAVRSLRRSPTMSVAAIACIALGIGATTAIYAAVHTALVRPLPLPAADEMVVVYRTTPQFDRGPFSPGNFLDLRDRNESLTHLAAVSRGSALVRDEDGTEQLSVTSVSGDFFGATGIGAVRGRLLGPGDDDPDAPLAAVISSELWNNRYGGDPDVLGSTLNIGGEQHTVVGILPEGFQVPQGNRIIGADVWTPLRFTPQQATFRRSNYLLLLGRLADRRTPDAAHQELRAVMDRIVEEHPELTGEQLRVLPLQPEATASVRTPLLMLLGAVGFVLLIAASNVAALLLARGAARRREWAVRTAIGAGNRDVLQSAAVESLLITGLGSVLGLGIAYAGVRIIVAMLPSNLPQLQDLGLDPVILGIGLAVALVVGLLTGVAPAWQAQRTDPQRALYSSRTGASPSQQRFLRGLVATEVALSLVLLIGAGLVIRGFSTLIERDPGFDPDPLLALNVSLLPQDYAEISAVDEFLLPALDEIRAVSGVEEAALISHIPYQNWGSNFNVRYEGEPGGDPSLRPLVENRYITPTFFETIGIELLEGRLFEPTDALEDTPYRVVANRALAERDFPDGQEVVGKRFHLTDTTFATIVGVVENIRNSGPEGDPRPEVYWNVHQTSWGTSLPLMIRTAGDPATFAAQVADAIHDVDPAAAVSRIRPMNDIIAASVARPKFYLTLLGIFAVVALALAMAGLYGVMSYAVAQRIREIGIRAALGSAPRDSLAMVLKGGMVLVAIGAAVGLVGAWGVTGVLESFLFGVSPLDPAAWAAATLGLALAGFLALMIPAARAARVDPMDAIREE